MIQRVRQLPAICGDECSRDLVGEKVQEILTANGAETSEQDYENLAASTSQKDKILTQAIRTGHAWRLFKVDSEGTHLTDSGRLYNYAVSRLSGHKVPGRDRDTAMSYDFRNAKINSFQQGGFNSGSHTFNDHGMNQTQMEQASDLIRLLLVEAPGLVSAATELHTELRRVEQEGGAPDRRRTGSVLSNITNGLSAGSAALALAEAIRDSLGL
ncbi:hypothetical protein [Streptomyces sp. NPDC007172]|uniref:hypothetical protein n=1 Tax=Streptomyces sp. NPDC007172 TaxID=3364776 RepID=UPI0036D0716A